MMKASLTRRKFLKGVGSAPFVPILANRARSSSQLLAAESPEPGPSDWPRFGFDLKNTRFNPHEKSLGKGNVGGLKPRWRREVGAPIQTTPAVVGDTLFFTTYAGDLWALDSQTGQVRWKFKVGEPRPTETRFLRSSPNYANGRLYFGTGKAEIVCVDASQGKEIWRVVVDEDPGGNQAQITCSPTVFDGKVYTGTTSAHAQLACLDGDTGVARWRFYTVPHVTNGGGSIWSSPTIDEEHRVIYNGTGNADSFMPAGPVLFTESIIANDLDTGKLLWFYQARPADVPYNLDFACHPMIFDAQHPDRPGAVRHCVGAGKKSGFYTLDRHTGELYWKVMLTNHSPGGGPTLNSTAVAYNRIFVVSNATPFRRPPSSVTAGLNAFTGDIEWWVHNTAVNRAPVAVANEVFYQGLMDGTLEAMDVATGERLWEYQLPSGHRGGIAITNGAMYVSNGGPFREGQTKKYSMYCFTVDGT